jgi:uncharacterized tellurite resistance protein B-like protein
MICYNEKLGNKKGINDMSIFDIFAKYGQNDDQVESYNKLFQKLKKEYPDVDESSLVTMSCISGVMARVAYVDFKLDDAEKEKIILILKEWNIHPSFRSEDIARMAIHHIKDMAGLENHLYVHPLKENLTPDERYQVLQSLFIVAASDGEVEGIESEEIRTICKGLELSNQHFLSARAEVASYLKALG